MHIPHEAHFPAKVPNGKPHKEGKYALSGRRVDMDGERRRHEPELDGQQEGNTEDEKHRGN